LTFAEGPLQVGKVAVARRAFIQAIRRLLVTLVTRKKISSSKKKIFVFPSSKTEKNLQNQRIDFISPARNASRTP
jgi:hypothetical protein